VEGLLDGDGDGDDEKKKICKLFPSNLPLKRQHRRKMPSLAIDMGAS